MTSLVTRCPACTTLFKVVPDQLRISEGWVRCGQCDEVFDANAHMQPAMDLAGEAPAGVQVDESVVLVRPDAPVASEESALLLTPEDIERPGAQALKDDLAESVHSLHADDVPGTLAPEPQSETPQPGEGDLRSPTTISGAVSEESATPEPAEPALDDAALIISGRFKPSAAPVQDVREVLNPSFLMRRAKPQRRAAGWLVGAFAVVLLSLLLLQVAVQERDRIVATEPATAPALMGLCRVLGCQIQPLKEIQSIVIESSSFVKVKADVYRLSFAIKNTALVPLALPSAELALTDLRDQSVLRRVLSPAEYGSRTATLAPGEDLSVVVPVGVKAAVPESDKVTGYRLLVFYP